MQTILYNELWPVWTNIFKIILSIDRSGVLKDAFQSTTPIRHEAHATSLALWPNRRVSWLLFDRHLIYGQICLQLEDKGLGAKP